MTIRPVVRIGSCWTSVIVVVEGPSAAGKTTWCRRHARRWLPEPGPWPMARVLAYQRSRWREALRADAAGEVVVLDGDPFKLYYPYAQRWLGEITTGDWDSEVARARRLVAAGDRGLADLVLYADPGAAELARRRDGDPTRSRRNFARHTAMRPAFRRWYEAVASLDPARVVWSHPDAGLTEDLLAVGRRDPRSGAGLFGRLLTALEPPPPG
jgi:GTPase SAR1 family protein